jgi:hypothetical protein
MTKTLTKKWYCEVSKKVCPEDCGKSKYAIHPEDKELRK